MSEISIDTLKTMLANLDDAKKYQSLRDVMETLPAPDLAAVFEDLPAEKLPVLFRLCPKDLAADVFTELTPETQQKLIDGLTDTELKAVVDELFVDDATDLVEEMPANVVKRILGQADPTTRRMINELLQYPEDSAGGVMTTELMELRPEAEEVDFALDMKDLRIDTFRSSGAGGQHINKTSSAIRITHIPTGTVVECQNERSQFQNKDKALEILRSRLLAQKQKEQQDAINADRAGQVGTGDRSEKIRTYNFPQDRCTDHRIGLTVHNLDKIMDGNLDDIIDALATREQAERLQKLNA